MTESSPHINHILNDISLKLSNEIKTLNDFINILNNRSFGLLIFLFALPMALPIPVPPGVNLLFAIPLLLLSFQQILCAQTPWLPQNIKNKPINHKKFDLMIAKAKPWLARLSWFIKPRLSYVTKPFFIPIIGLFSFAFALCVCIPIPLTNTVPSFAILLMALGLLMHDGLAIIIGMITGTLWVSLLATLGVAGFKALIHTIF